MAQVTLPDSNILNLLMTIPFCNNLSHEERCDLKSKRPTPHLSIKETGKNRCRNFQPSWYERFPWLTGCSERNRMFCYTCLLFGESDLEWCTEGVSDLSNLIKKAVKHQSSKHHLLHSEAFHMLGKTRKERISSEAFRRQHNQIVFSNRQYLRRLSQVVMFLSKQGLAFRGDGSAANRGNYIELLDLLAQNESMVRDHLQSSLLLKGTSPDIEIDLIQAINVALNERIKYEMKQSPFISIQADETPDISCNPQMSIVFRYCVDDRIEERLVGFYDASRDETAEELSEVIRQALLDWDIDGKIVVSQTYDGAFAMPRIDGEVQSLVKGFCPHALFIHCYEHQLNLVLLHSCKTIKQVRLFVCALTAFREFFSKSSKRMVLLTERGLFSTSWNFHSRAVQTLKKHFAHLYSKFNEIIDGEGWDSETVNCAMTLKRHMDDPMFVYLLCVFEASFTHIDLLVQLLESSTVSVAAFQKEIEAAISNIKKLRSDTFAKNCIIKSMILNQNVRYESEKRHALKVLTFEIIDFQAVQMRCRFQHLPKLNFVELVHENKFKDYSKSFPQDKVTSLVKHYPFFDTNQLQNELHNIYADEKKHIPPNELLKYFVVNGLDSIFKEVTKLLRLVLTMPTTAAGSAGCRSTLKRIKTYVRNCANNNGLPSLNSLAVEKNFLGDLSSEPEFLERVVDIFAQKKPQLVYKAVGYKAHFTYDQFENNRQDNRRILRWDAVPTVFGKKHNPKPKGKKLLATPHSKNESEDDEMPEVEVNAEVLALRRKLDVCQNKLRVLTQHSEALDSNLKNFFTEEEWEALLVGDSGKSSSLADTLTTSDDKLDIEKDVKEDPEVLALRLKLKLYKKSVTTLTEQLDSKDAYLKKVFGDDQLKCLRRGKVRSSHWQTDTIEKAVKLYITCGTIGYNNLRKQKFPLPSIRTLQRRMMENADLRIVADVDDDFALLQTKAGVKTEDTTSWISESLSSEDSSHSELVHSADPLALEDESRPGTSSTVDIASLPGTSSMGLDPFLMPSSSSSAPPPSPSPTPTPPSPRLEMPPPRFVTSQAPSPALQSTNVTQSLPIPQQKTGGQKKTLEETVVSSDLQRNEFDDALLETNQLDAALQRLQCISEKVDELGGRDDNFDNFGKYVASLLRGLPTQRAVDLQQEVINLILRSHINPETPSVDSNSASAQSSSVPSTLTPETVRTLPQPQPPSLPPPPLAPLTQRLGQSKQASSTVPSVSVGKSVSVPPQRSKGEKRPLPDDASSSEAGNKQCKLDNPILETEQIDATLKKLEEISDKVNQLNEKDDNFDNFGKYAASLLRCLPTQRAVELQREVVNLILREHGGSTGSAPQKVRLLNV